MVRSQSSSPVRRETRGKRRATLAEAASAAKHSRPSTPPSPPPPPKLAKRFREFEKMKQRAAEWEGWTPTDHVSLVPISSTTHFGGVVTKEGYRITPKDSLRVEPGEAEEYQAKLEAVVAHGVQQVLRDVSEEHRGQVIIRNPHLHNTFMSTKWTRFANFSVTDLLNKFLEAKQSEDSKGGEPIRLEDCEFDFVHVEVTRYGTLKSQRLESRLELDYEEWAGNKKSLVDPIGAYQRKQLARGCEDWCMVIALLLGKHRVDHPTLSSSEYTKYHQRTGQLHKVFEAWHWEKRSSTLLRGYVTTHYMEKEYASGFPGGVESQEQKQAHADACSRSLFGEPADVSKFAENSGKRTLAKGMLNNFWGYFGKRDDHAQHNFVTTKEELLKIIHDQSLDIVSFDMTPNGDVALVGTKTKIPKPSAKTSRLIAAFTTSMARLRLYNVLEAHSDSVIYMDTDSVYYIYSEHNPGPSTPGTLGELKNELRPGCYISKMSCTGPKSYATVTKDREGAVVDTAVHLKGISAGACRVVPLVEHSEIRKLVDGDALNISVPQTQFRKDLASQTVTTRDFQKSIRYYSTKRRFILNSQRQDTLPYGYTD